MAISVKQYSSGWHDTFKYIQIIGIDPHSPKSQLSISTMNRSGISKDLQKRFFHDFPRKKGAFIIYISKRFSIIFLGTFLGSSQHFANKKIQHLTGHFPVFPPFSLNFFGVFSCKVVPQFGIAKLVQITPISLWFMVNIT